MNIDISNLAFGISLANLIGFVILIWKAATKFGAIETKVETMWTFQMRRAMSEVVSSGLGSLNSPLLFTDEALCLMNPLKAELEAWWAALPKATCDSDALLKLEAEFGDRLLPGVCVPAKISHAACLLLALAVAKNENTIELMLKK